jgi:hypothetical protein
MSRTLGAAAVGMVIGLVVLAALPAETAEGEVTYVMAWDTTGVTYDTSGWSVVTDLGYEVHVASATLTTFTVTMVDCPHTHGLLQRIRNLFGVATARAGHTSGPDPALVGGPLAETIGGEPSTLGTTTVSEPSYCEGHVAFGGNGEAPTLEVTGVVVSTDGERLELDVSTTVDWGTLRDLVDDEGRTIHAVVGEPLEITVIRDAAALFDGVDFASDSSEYQATQMLRSMADSVRFVVTGGDTHP